MPEDDKDDKIILKVIYLKAIVILDRESDKNKLKDIIYYIDITDGDISVTNMASHMAILADNLVYHTIIKVMPDTRVGHYYNTFIFQGLMLNTNVNYALIAGI